MTQKEIIDFLKAQESVSRCESQRGTVEHCSCLGYILSVITCKHKEKIEDMCAECGRTLTNPQ